MQFQFQPVEARSKFQLYQNFVVQTLQFLQANGNIQGGTTIYGHQVNALLAIHEKFQGYQPYGPGERAALIVAPTGGGKSGMISLLPYVLGSNKALVISPSLCITEQLEQDFGIKLDGLNKSFVCKTRLVTGRENLNSFLETAACVIRHTRETFNMDRMNLVIVNAQKFGGRSAASLRPQQVPQEEEDGDDEAMMDLTVLRQNFNSFSTLIVDEAHHYPAETWDLIVDQFAGKQIIFLTATPYRGSTRQALWPGQEPTFRITMPELIQKNILRKLTYRNLETNVLDANESITQEQYARIGEVIQYILQEHDQLVPGVKHLAMVLVLTKEMAEAGSGATPRSTFFTTKAPPVNLRSFESDNNMINTMFVCGRLLEGYDNSRVSVCVILRKVGSLGLFTQFVGRSIRTSAKDGTDVVPAVIISHPRYQQETLFKDYIDANGLSVTNGNHHRGY